MLSSALFLSSEPDGDDVSNIIRKITTVLNSDKSTSDCLESRITVVVGCDCKLEGTPDVLAFPTVMSCLVWLYRRFGLHRNEREIIINEEDQLVVLQLCLAERNKQLNGDFDSDMSDVLIANRALIGRKLSNKCAETIDEDVFNLYAQFLKDSNASDYLDIINGLMEELTRNEELQGFIAKLDIVAFYAPAGEVEKAAFSLLCKSKTIFKTDLELPLDGSDACNVITSPSSYDEVLASSVNNSSSTTFSVTEVYLELVFTSYLQLLVNSRSELALARVFNVPDRELDHAAFTSLKHESKVKGMPMFQTASSYIMRLRLGGKGYAPDPKSAVNEHVKGFGEFVDFVHKLQTVVEEEVNPGNAVEKVVNLIRNVIIRSKTNTLRKSSVETVASHLKELIPQCTAFQHSAYGVSPQRADCNGGSVIGRKTLQILRQMIDRNVTQPMRKKSTDILSDVLTSQKTPIRLPSLFSQFKSPEILECSPQAKESKSLAERLLPNVKKIEKKRPLPRYQASLDWVRSDDISKPEELAFYQEQQMADREDQSTNTEIKGDCKSVDKAKKFLESMLDKENIENALSVPCYSSVCDPPSERVKSTTKRGLELEENAPSKRQKTSQRSRAKKTIKKAAKPLPKGQMQLTRFFRC